MTRPIDRKVEGSIFQSCTATKSKEISHKILAQDEFITRMIKNLKFKNQVGIVVLRKVRKQG